VLCFLTRAGDCCGLVNERSAAPELSSTEFSDFLQFLSRRKFDSPANRPRFPSYGEAGFRAGCFVLAGCSSFGLRDEFSSRSHFGKRRPAMACRLYILERANRQQWRGAKQRAAALRRGGRLAAERVDCVPGA
jgi:hypothetical protein